MPKESTRSIDHNGFMLIRDNPISKIGVYPYLGSEIPVPGLEPNKIYGVYRSAEELGDQAAIDSFKLQPFIDDHEVLGQGGTPAERKGIQGYMGEQIHFDGTYLRGNIKIPSSAAQSLISAGKTELSPAYRCKWVPEEGSFGGKPYQFTQRQIRGNHLALVDEGRTGPDVAIQDSAVMLNDPHMSMTLDSAELINMEFTPEQLAQIEAMLAKMMAAKTTGDEDPAEQPSEDADSVVEPMVEVTPEQEDAAQETVAAASEAESALEAASEALAEVAAAAEQVVATDSKDKVKQQAAKTKLATAKAKHAKLQKVATDSVAKLRTVNDKSGVAADRAIIKQLQAQIAELSKPPVALDSSKLMAEIADRDALAGQLSKFVGSFDHSRMTCDAVAQYGVEKLGLKTAKGTERIALNAWMHGRKPDHETIHIASDSKKTGSALQAWGKK